MDIFEFHRLKKGTLYLILVHVLCWTICIAVEIYSARSVLHNNLEPAWIYAVFYAINISLFYGILTLLRFTRLNRDLPWWYQVVMWLSLIILFLVIKFLINNAIYYKGSGSIWEQLKFFPGFVPSTAVRSIHFVIPALLYGAAIKSANYQRELLEAEKVQLVREKVNAELASKLAISENAFLRQQLNPHMLFNALNLIYSYVQKQSDDGGKVMEHLTDILRYSLTTSGGGDEVPLTDELAQIDNLIAINQKRFHYPLSLNVLYKGDLKSYRVAPLILFTLTENIFKHGDLRPDQSPATLVIEMEETGRLNYKSHNVCKAKSRYERSSQIGLQNIRTRLEFLYPGRYTLDTNQTDHMFTVNLQIQL